MVYKRPGKLWVMVNDDERRWIMVNDGMMWKDFGPWLTTV